MKIFISTPVHGWEVSGGYMATMDGLQRLCRHRGISLLCQPRFGRSDLIQARNMDLHRFLKSGADRLITFDADQVADPADFLRLAEGPYPLCAAPVPKKTRDWPTIVANARAGHDDPELCSGVFNFKCEQGPPMVDGDWMRILAAGAGMMCADRKVVIDMATDHSFYMCEGTPLPRLYARDLVDPDALFPTEMSEDYTFCMKAAESGYRTWLCWPIMVGHYGMSLYRGRLRA